ncbi:adenylate kinase [Pedobacter aquatilis]|uniref:adenylate kinase n=1 Tax=Pedobacter aquatilis TaxID=351343 RepID=UPI00293136B2|nr:adenylate kinase [Pedobacter aquatilis]
MKIHIFGASCAGSSTLGKALSASLNIPYFDTDDYFWEESVIPYTRKRDTQLRNAMLSDAISQLDHYIIGGSLVSWGEEWKTRFNLAVFLYLPPALRLKRLVLREEQRYGEAIYTNPVRKVLFEEFQQWAKNYDDPVFSGRSLKIHEEWLKSLSCEQIKITGNTTVAERIAAIRAVYR